MTQALAILRKPFRVPTVEELLSRSSVDGTLLKPTSSCDMSESGTSGDSLSCSSDDDGTWATVLLAHLLLSLLLLLLMVLSLLLLL